MRSWNSKPETPPAAPEELREWVKKQMKPQRPWLLAHADDGVIWGCLFEGNLALSSDVSPVSPPLRYETLQQAFIFGPAGEVRLWYDDETGAWVAREITGGNGTDDWDVDYLLWGTEVVSNFSAPDFTHIREAQAQPGLDQVVPQPVTSAGLKARKLKLIVRHYLDEDLHTGELRIALSRLVDLVAK